MRKIIAILCVGALLCVGGCAPRENTARTSCDTLVTAVEQSQAFEEMTRLSPAQAAKFLGIEETDAAELLLAMDASRATAELILAVTAKDEAALARIETAVQDFLETLRAEYGGYNPEEMPKLETALLETRGLQVALVVGKDNALAADALIEIWR